MDSAGCSATSNWTDADWRFMGMALDLARNAAEVYEEVPVGAVLVHGGQIAGTGCNRPIASHDPTAHAEIEAIRHASRQLNNYRLAGATLYVSLEPCIMCAGAIGNARIQRLVFAARDLRFGAIRSRFRLADSELLNHHVQVEEGLLGAEAAALLKAFFAERRVEKE